MAAARRAGALSSRLAGLFPPDGRRLLSTCRHLPDAVRLVSLRDVPGPWPRCPVTTTQRLLQLETLTAARMQRATICVWQGDQSPKLTRVAEALGVPVEAVPLSQPRSSGRRLPGSGGGVEGRSTPPGS